VNEGRGRPRVVFIVDDDDLVRAAIQGMLKSVGLRPSKHVDRKPGGSAAADAVFISLADVNRPRRCPVSIAIEDV
jgi:FixJ family two-component response regulator